MLRFIHQENLMNGGSSDDEPLRDGTTDEISAKRNRRAGATGVEVVGYQ